MFSGHNFIGHNGSAKNSKKLRAFSTIQKSFLPEEFTIATEAEIEEALSKAQLASNVYKKTSYKQRAFFLETIATEIVNIGDFLIQRAMQESGLPERRLIGERDRTVHQLKLFAEVLREGSWIEAVVDAAIQDRKPLPRPDLRKMLIPLGPVAVFGASNFPFAFSTAGGDTASALAAGCAVIVKAHPAHLGTNELVANAIINAAKKCGMPDGVFSSLVGEGAALGQLLAKHPAIKAIGFTGSYRAGMALFKTAINDRAVPIPVYAEMSSINPVLILPQKLEKDMDWTASQLAGSITLGAGQFCTKPGLLFIINNPITENFIQNLVGLLKSIPEATMLNESICSNYYAERGRLLQEKGVVSLVNGKDASDNFKGSVALLEVKATDFISNTALQHEVFGPCSLLIRCDNHSQLLQALQSLHGQLTGSIMGTAHDIDKFSDCIEILTEKVGRLIYNGVPTGVEVCYAMVHGGPFPATSDSRSTSVGAEAIKRFVRPICFQDCPEEFLPEPLKNENPLAILRKINGVYTKEPVIL